jgi:hypothetical protein
MSETTQTDAQQGGSEEDRVLAMLGLDAEGNASDRDAEDAEQPEQGAAPEKSDQPETKDAETEPPETAPIEPPQFWTKEAKEHWDAIPAETQKYLATREAERDAEVRRSQNTAAETRQQAERLAGEIAQERAYLTQHLVPAIQAVNQRLSVDYSPEGLAELARTNPAEWAAKVAERDNLIAMSQQLQAEQNRTDQIAIQGEMARLVAAVPEMADPAQGRKAMADWASLAVEKGFTQQEMAAVKDHRVFLVLRDLAQAKAELAALKSAKEAPARKAVQPVVTRPVNATRPRPETGNRALSRDVIMKAARSSSNDAQVAVMEQMLGLKG